jgi:hypothetical protein
MRKIGAVSGFVALAAVVFSTLPTAAFGFHLGPFYFHVPFVGHHHHRHHVYPRVNPNVARTRPNDVPLAGRNAEALESCTGLVPGVTDLPIDQIRQMVHPTADQEAALENLRAASSRASDIIRSSCPAAVPLTPIGRLDSADRQLDATIEAIQIVRSPLERFYEVLADEQRVRFNATNASAEGSGSNDMAAACRQLAGSLIDLPAQRIEQVVRPTEQQQSAFDELKKRQEMLATTCNRRVRPRCPNRPWRGLIRWKHG